MVAITALNGALPLSLLSPVGRGFLLRPDAAASYVRCQAAGCPAGITTAYRTRAEQQALLDRYGYPHAEYPGHSQHGEGVALDLPEPARAWMVANGRDHGWVRTITAEPWHFEYQPQRDVIPDPAPAAKPEPLTPEDRMWKDLVLARVKNSAEVWVGDGITRRHVRTELEVADLSWRISRAGGNGAVEIVDRIEWLGDVLAAPGGVDYAALAKAVADEQARRLSS